MGSANLRTRKQRTRQPKPPSPPSPSTTRVHSTTTTTSSSSKSPKPSADEIQERRKRGGRKRKKKYKKYKNRPLASKSNNFRTSRAIKTQVMNADCWLLNDDDDRTMLLMPLRGSKIQTTSLLPSLHRRRLQEKPQSVSLAIKKTREEEEGQMPASRQYNKSC